jgi:hypothetical protein
MNGRPAIIVTAFLSVVAFTTLVVLSQAQVIFLPYLTPTSIEFYGLEDQYPVNGSMTYSISLKGYGSNCIGFTAQTLHKKSSVPEGEERVAFFSKTDDCRKITISHGPYNYSQNFSYSGHVVLGDPGDYRVRVHVFDRITEQNSTDMRLFKVK